VLLHHQADPGPGGHHGHPPVPIAPYPPLPLPALRGEAVRQQAEEKKRGNGGEETGGTAVSKKGIFGLVVILGSLLLALILGASLMLYAENLAHPDIVFPQANRSSFSRVAILMDGTRSVGTLNYGTIQEIVQEK